MSTSELNRMILAGGSSGIPVVAYGSLPAAAASNGMIYKCYDPNGVLSDVYVESNGVIWRPLNGRALLYHNPVATTPTTASAETNHIALKIPGDLVSKTGGLEIMTNPVYVGTNNTKNPVIRHNTTSAAVTGGTLAFSTAYAASTLSGPVKRYFFNNGTDNAHQAWSGSASNAGYNSSSATNAAGAIDMASDSYLNFNMIVTNNSTDTGGYADAQVYWFEK